MTALNLLRLADLFLDDVLAQRAARLFTAESSSLRAYPTAFPVMLSALDWLLDGGKEVALVGPLEDPGLQALLAAMRGAYLPNAVVAAGVPGKTALPLLQDKPLLRGKPTAYVCQNRVCQLPTNDPAVAARQVAAPHPLD